MKDTVGYSQRDHIHPCDCHASLVVSNNVAFNDGMMDLPNTAPAIYCLPVPAGSLSHAHLGRISISSSILSPL